MGRINMDDPGLVAIHELLQYENRMEEIGKRNKTA